jgi:hypothetical protein
MSEQDLFGDDDREASVDPRPEAPVETVAPVGPVTADVVVAPAQDAELFIPAAPTIDDRLREVAGRLRVARDVVKELELEYQTVGREYASLSEREIPLHVQNELAAQIDRASAQRRAELREKLVASGFTPADLQLLTR